MNKFDVDLYSLSKIQGLRFKLGPSYNLCHRELDNPLDVKKWLNISEGCILNGKKYVKLYLLELAQSLYISSFIGKKNLFFINMDAILIKNILFIFPLSGTELELFNNLYRKSNKIYLYNFGIYSISKFLVRKFFKKIKIKLFFYKICIFNELESIDSFLKLANHDISNIVGDNVLSNRLFHITM